MNNENPLAAGCNGTADLDLVGASGGGNGGDRTGHLTWSSGEPVWAAPVQPGEAISLTVGGERPAYPLTGNISTMDLMGELTRTFETTATSGYMQALRDGEPVTLTLTVPWVEKVLKGEGAKHASYCDYLEKRFFFSRDEDRHRHRDWDRQKLDEAANCEHDFEPGDVDALLAEKWAYLRWLLSDGMPVRFLDHPHQRTGEDDAEMSVHQYAQRITVRWQTKKPYPYDKLDMIVPINVFCWEMPAEKFKVFIDSDFNVTYSFAFEQQNVSSNLLRGRVPVGLIAALETFMAKHPMPGQTIND